MPADLRAALAPPKVKAAWDSLTPLAQNEFICWVTSAKQEATRKGRILRAREELLEGNRRPCCWIGCTHRNDKPMSPSQAFLLGRRRKA
jgi:hypothetical protein